MKKRIIRLLGISLIITLMIACIPARADDNDGWMSISIGHEKGVELEAYLIATGDYGDWTMLKDFSDITVFTRGDGSFHVDAALSQIRKRIDDWKIKPVKKQKSDAEGKVEFKNLERGIYFVMMRDEMESLKISPMLLAVPNKEGSVQVRANAKYEVVTPSPSPTPTPKPTFTPFVTPEETPTRKGPTPEPTRTPAPPTSTPAPTPSPTPDTEKTPVPDRPSPLPPHEGEKLVPLEDYETALGLGNIQMHVGVCFD